MENVKTISASLFFMALVLTNLGLIAEHLYVKGTGATWSWAGLQEHKITMDTNEETIAIALDRMNVFYVGIDNPITVAMSGVGVDELKLKGSEGLSLESKGKGQYVVTCTQPGKATITVTHTGSQKSKEFNFRVKRIPDPVVHLGGKRDGVAGSGWFKAQSGLIASIKNFDMYGGCKIQRYTLYYTCKGCEPLQFTGTEGRFSGAIREVILRAKPGDQYAFTNVQVRCPGDAVGRRLNGLAFKIK